MIVLWLGHQTLVSGLEDELRVIETHKPKRL